MVTRHIDLSTNNSLDENVSCIYSLANLYNSVQLTNVCEYFIFSHFGSVKRTDTYKDLPLELRQELQQKLAKSVKQVTNT
jgi:hypothetical protein